MCYRQNQKGMWSANAIAGGYYGLGMITYDSSNTNVAAVDTFGNITILKVGSTVITATKAADGTFAHAAASYTLTVESKSVTITGVGASNKTYDGGVTANPIGGSISGLAGGTVTIVPGTAVFNNKNVGDGKPVTFSGYSLGGADAGNYTLFCDAFLSHRNRNISHNYISTLYICNETAV